MNSHCWRNPRLEGKKEKDKGWPELQSENHQKRKNDSQTLARQQPQNSASNILVDNHSEIPDQFASNLSTCDYPELGGKMWKRKNDSGKDPAAIINDNVVTFDDNSGSKIKAKKYLKRSKRSNLIRINIQQALEVITLLFQLSFLFVFFITNNKKCRQHC